MSTVTGSRHPEAFEGDWHIEEELRRLVGKWGVKTIVETGTHKGKSTRALAEMLCQVVTIEIKPELEEIWHLSNVQLFVGDSGELLGDLLPMLRWGEPILFYLDAHWEEHSPLLEELEGIAGAELRNKPVIAIHDFYNPFHPEYGYDTWDIGPYRLELVEGALDKIYGARNWAHHYNEEAAGLKRGIIYVEPAA
jgi:hypothetical protein